MRKAVLVLTLLCLTACDPAGESTASSVVETTSTVASVPTPAPTAPSTTVAAPPPVPAGLTRAEQTASALGCVFIDAAKLTPQADSTVTCQFEGIWVRVDVFPSDDNLDQYMGLLRTQGCAAARDEGRTTIEVATLSLWLVTPMNAADSAITAAVADWLGGEVLTIECGD